MDTGCSLEDLLGRGWKIGKDGEKELEKSMLSKLFDDAAIVKLKSLINQKVVKY